MIKDKDYNSEYEQLIQRAKDSNRTKKDSSVYYERHHILPKCMGGTDTRENLVLLTAQEHIKAHWLLHKMYPDHVGLAYASMRLLTVDQSDGKHVRLDMTDEQLDHLAELKRCAANATSERNRKNWSDPEYAKKYRSFIISQNQSERNRKINSECRKKDWSNPEYRERMSKLSKDRMSKPEMRAHLSQCAKIQMSDPDMQLKMQRSRALNVGRRLLSERFVLNAYSFDLACKEYRYNFPNLSMVSLQRVIDLFGSFQSYLKALGVPYTGLEDLACRE